MSWSVKYNPATKIVEVIYSGKVTEKDLLDAVNERVRVQAKHASLFVLIDCSQVRSKAGGAFDVHNLPGKTYGSAKGDRKTCHALVLSQYPQARDASFHYETACKNRGWHVRPFEVSSDAVGWLEEKLGFDR